MILVSFLKASQRRSHVASCDVFDGCVVGIHLCTIRPYLAMCYASKQISYWYIYDFLLDILFLRVVTIFSCIQPCVGCILACYSFHLVILVSFLKASQRRSHVASCDVFDGCVVGIHLCTIRPYLAMCYASKQISYWYIYDFLLDILFLRVVTILGVHPSL